MYVGLVTDSSHLKMVIGSDNSIAKQWGYMA